MTLSISLALPSDIPYLSTIQWAALFNNPLVQTLYPQGPTPALTAFTRESYQKAIQFHSVRLIKATDQEQGEIIAFAKWIIYAEEEIDPVQPVKGHLEDEEEGKSASGWEYIDKPPRPEGVNEKALYGWNAIISRTRMKIMRKKGHACHSEGECSLECYFASIAPSLWGRFQQVKPYEFLKD